MPTRELRKANRTLESEVAERRTAEQALRVSEANQRRLLESTNVIPWEADARTWMFTYVGPQAEKLMGYPCKQWLEKDFWLDHIHPEDRTWVPNYCAKSSNKTENFEFSELYCRQAGYGHGSMAYDDCVESRSPIRHRESP